MTQVGMEAQWLEFLRLYVEPLQSKVYTGYHHYVCVLRQWNETLWDKVETRMGKQMRK